MAKFLFLGFFLPGFASAAMTCEKAHRHALLSCENAHLMKPSPDQVTLHFELYEYASDFERASMIVSQQNRTASCENAVEQCQKACKPKSVGAAQCGPDGRLTQSLMVLRGWLANMKDQTQANDFSAPSPRVTPREEGGTARESKSNLEVVLSDPRPGFDKEYIGIKFRREIPVGAQ